MHLGPVLYFLLSDTVISGPGLAVSPDGVPLQLKAEVAVTVSTNLLTVEPAWDLAAVAASSAE